MPVLNPPNTGGLIASNTLNLTRVAIAIAGALGLVTAGSGLGLSSSDVDFAGLDGSQRVAIIVALIGAAAIIQATDLLARSIATSRAVNSSIVALPTPRAAVQTVDATSKVSGKVVAIRAGDDAMLFYDADNDTMVWVPETAIRFS